MLMTDLAMGTWRGKFLRNFASVVCNIGVSSAARNNMQIDTNTSGRYRKVDVGSMCRILRMGSNRLWNQLALL
eukprot:3992117-Amphidinium_carterae.1